MTNFQQLLIQLHKAETGEQAAEVARLASLDPYEQGYTAFHNDVSWRDNPHSGENAAEWDRGWNEAYEVNDQFGVGA